MKKAIFLGFAALLALAVFSCSDPIAQQDEGGGISLNVKDSAGRALVGTTSEAGTNYYEAAFLKAGNPVVRATWNFARNGRIQIEPGTYEVILMAGRNADKTLLGVGAATNITGKGSGAANGSVNPDTLSVTITTSTTDIHFTVYPLVNDINNDGHDGLIEDENGPGDPDADQDGESLSTFFTALNTLPTSKYPLPTTKDELGNIIPIFMINQGAPTAATWTYGIRELGDTSGATIAGTGNLLDIFASSVVIARAANGTPQFFVTGFSVPEELDIPQLLDISNPPSWDATDTTPGTSLTGSFGMVFTAPAGGDGIVQVAFQVPVVAFSDAATDNPVIWYIRGGLNNGSLDAGIGNDGNGGGLPAKSGMLGGAVVLGFGNLSAFPEVQLHQ